MRRNLIILATTCAVLGVVLGSLLHPVSSTVRLTAQEPSVALPPPPDVSAFTPEEQVNIRVYENVNRSVVNITTRAVRTNMMFMEVVPTEGSGSGSILDKQGHVLTN